MTRGVGRAGAGGGGHQRRPAGTVPGAAHLGLCTRRGGEGWRRCGRRARLAVACDAGDELARPRALDLALRRQGRTAEREQVLRDGVGYVAAHGLGKTTHR